ncbi:MAG: type II secretion system protein [Planctomycetota bacterium]|nr:type II secretion system protein [Planctomycetota bacterium]
MTMLELLVVIGIISLLMAAIFGMTSRMRSRAKASTAKSLIETCQNALESYHLDFREYPPDAFGAYNGPEALAYFLTRTYRKTPSGAGEVAATLNCGPFGRFSEQEVRDLGSGRPVIVDPWFKPVMYKVTTQVETDVWDNTKTRTKKTIQIYSFGPDQTDNGGTGDDVVSGK